MKYINKIPPYFEDYDKRGLIGDSENITIDELRQIDIQLNQYNLEVVWFNNGAALNWTIKLK